MNENLQFAMHTLCGDAAFGRLEGHEALERRSVQYAIRTPPTGI